MKRTLFILLLLLTAASVASCGSDDMKTDETTASAEGTVTAAVNETTESAVKDNVPDLDYGGETFTMFIRTEDQTRPEFYVTEETGDIVNDAIWSRNLAVKERLNLEFAYVENQSDNATRAEWANMLTQNIMAGDGAYDVAAGYSMSMATLASNGMLCDMRATKYLDFSQPWWSDSLLKESVIGDKLYFASGDISTWMILYTYGTLFNKNMIENYDLESPYELVDSGKWTIDKMMDMAKGIYGDLNGNNKLDAEDRFGFTSSPIFVDTFYFASGLRTTDSTGDGVVMSEDFGSEKTVDLLDKVISYVKDNDDIHVFEYGTNYNFEHGNTLFSLAEITFAYTTLRSVTFDYGMLPIPKYDETQEDYYTITSFPYTLYGIPLDAKDPDMTSAVMECLACESHKQVVPALFEVALKVKYSRDEADSRMYDILREGVVFDIGRVFNDSLGSKTYSLFRECITSRKSNWASTVEKNVTALNKQLEQLFGEFD